MPSLRSILNLPNALTVVRLPLAALLWWAADSRMWVLAVAALGAFTDLVDGYLARYLRARGFGLDDDSDREAAMKRAEAVGAWLDPVCDKTFVVSLFAVVVVFHSPPLLFAMVVTREALILLLMAIGLFAPVLRTVLRQRFRANFWGKATTVAQFSAIVAVLVAPALTLPCAIAAAFFGAAAVLIYLHRDIRTARMWHENRFVMERLKELGQLDSA